MTVDLGKIANKKNQRVRDRILGMVKILEAAGLPIDGLTPRRVEKIAMTLLALGDLKHETPWAQAKSVADERSLRTRDIIRYINSHFEESISDSSYDDIRRKDLVRPVQAGLVVKSAPTADTNDGTRGYFLSVEFCALVRTYESDAWTTAVETFDQAAIYAEYIRGERSIERIAVSLPDGATIELQQGPHNRIQAAVVNDFLPRYGYGAKVLYIADTSNKHLVQDDDGMERLGLTAPERGMLPDVVAYSEEKDWLYLIEAVHSSNPLSAERCYELLNEVLPQCRCDVVFVTAFLDRSGFRKYAAEISWETEVWIASDPDHMIHYNGDKFFGPYVDEAD